MTPDLILRLAAVLAALVLAGLATLAAGKDGADGCLPIILGIVAAFLLLAAFTGAPAGTP